MNVKTSPIGAPPLASRAVNGLVRLFSSIRARVPEQLAGESRKTVNGEAMLNYTVMTTGA